jgi:uncharacterized protein YndB with AHSA1/START domain
MNGTLHHIDGRWVLRFERRLAHSRDKVWRAITDPAQLTRWFPADLDYDLAPGAKIRFDFRDGEGPTLDGEVTELDPPRLLAYTWDRDLLRFELRPDGEGCLLVFTHAFDDRGEAAKVGAGWHAHFDLLQARLDGQDVGWSAQDRWAEVHPGYLERMA